MPLLSVFYQFCPSTAADYCYQLWLSHGFQLRITRARSSKLGDYRFSSAAAVKHQISVNENLNPYSFLVTYIHEVAHLLTFQQYKRKVNPHGKEWKRNFQQLMHPILNETVFPASILLPLQAYMANPKASSCSDAVLLKALQSADLTGSQTFLTELAVGENFTLQGRVFTKGALKRTRILCLEKKSGKQYLIPGQAVVEKL
ncbi:SprT family zinc-dependent metalloprotease [Rhodocytophaga rosea]|uniref:SprT family zinc-dependent metalloprotease n=1 Tax=Rhodocytophaga rosea TaxID=2704465 RepID=A0A6C0GEL8_9BACT|nr:SprT-like domain-containing protein [Rhodocytophaga rosea]QHT66416.1 SprT family zinc-dependent metalloprotease [Rhodocytophaga rosea]